jgi:hypothetical protein
MADFCNQCANALGFEEGDLAGITTYEDFACDMASVVVCEGCGVIFVDPEGNCISNDCLGHNH